MRRQSIGKRRQNNASEVEFEEEEELKCGEDELQYENKEADQVQDVEYEDKDEECKGEMK